MAASRTWAIGGTLFSAGTPQETRADGGANSVRISSGFALAILGKMAWNPRAQGVADRIQRRKP